MRGIFSMRFFLCLRRCAVAFAVHCSPLSRALVANQQQISRLEIFVSDVVHALFEF